MPNLTFDAALAGRDIHCTIDSDRDLTGATFCFSLMAPARVASGGTLLRRVGGYTEIALPDISAGGTAALVIGYEDPYFNPANRAWLPMGGYLRLADGSTHALPVLPAGVITKPVTYPPCDGLRLVPPPRHWQPGEGTLAATQFTYRDAALSRVLPRIEALAKRCLFAPFRRASGTAILYRHDPDMAEEAYTLDIRPEGVTITASTDSGVFYAGITLLTLRETHNGQLPFGTITDAPRFSYRGQHLDCARHFFSVETILRLLDLMALLKLNHFHWHFADDEAFRLQTETAPELWQGSDYRGEGLPIPGVFGGGIRTGGSYSKADVARILKRAEALNINVLPEIEVPAHSLCINAILPGLRDAADNGAEVSVQGYQDNAVNPAMPATWDLLFPLASEVAAMFPMGTLHLGCDELAPGTWDGSPAATALKAREGLKSRDDLQGWTMAKLAAHLQTQGIRSAAWEEATRGAQGGIGHDALIFSWTGQGAGVEAARMGHDVVMCPAQNVYLDMAHTDDREDWGANWAAYISLEDTVNWHPVPLDAPDIADRVVGVEGTFWGEFTCRDVEMEAMLAPRILGVAAKGWEAEGQTSGPRLRQLAGAYAPLFDKMGWARHQGA